MPKLFKCSLHRKPRASTRVHSLSASRVLGRWVFSQPIYCSRSYRNCPKCQHPTNEHIDSIDSVVAGQLSRLYGGCLDCALCADES